MHALKELRHEDVAVLGQHANLLTAPTIKTGGSFDCASCIAHFFVRGSVPLDVCMIPVLLQNLVRKVLPKLSMVDLPIGVLLPETIPELRNPGSRRDTITGRLLIALDMDAARNFIFGADPSAEAFLILNLLRRSRESSVVSWRAGPDFAGEVRSTALPPARRVCGFVSWLLPLRGRRSSWSEARWSIGEWLAGLCCGPCIVFALRGSVVSWVLLASVLLVVGLEANQSMAVLPLLVVGWWSVSDRAAAVGDERVRRTIGISSRNLVVVVEVVLRCCFEDTGGGILLAARWCVVVDNCDAVDPGGEDLCAAVCGSDAWKLLPVTGYHGEDPRLASVVLCCRLVGGVKTLFARFTVECFPGANARFLYAEDPVRFPSF
eukprot:s646_g15.t1